MAENSQNLWKHCREKGEIARYEHFFLFLHSVFKRLVKQIRKNQGLFGKVESVIG